MFSFLRGFDLVQKRSNNEPPKASLAGVCVCGESNIRVLEGCGAAPLVAW